MIEIRKSKASDAKEIEYEHLDKLNPFDSSKFCFTLLEESFPLIMFGSTAINEGTHRLFMIMGKKGKHRPILYTKTVKSMLKNISYLDPATRRVEITVRDDFESGKNWAEMLGFVKEGLLHNYDPADSGDHVIYYLPKEQWQWTP